jgi:hypothetical protein
MGLCALAGIAVLAGCTGASEKPTSAPPTAESKTDAVAAPRWFALLRHGQVRWYDSGDAHRVAGALDSGSRPATAIAGGRDGEIVIAQAEGKVDSCAEQIELQHLDSGGHVHESVLPAFARVRGHVDEIAVSADRRQIALALEVSTTSGSDCDRPTLLTADLTSGARHTWHLPYEHSSGAASPRSDYGGYFVAGLAWAPDHRRLALTYGQCCAPSPGIWILNTHQSSGPLLPHLQRVKAGVSCPDVAFAWTSSGIVSDDNKPMCSQQRTTLVAIDPATGSARTLKAPLVPVPIAQLSADPNSDHLLVYADQSL